MAFLMPWRRGSNSGQGISRGQAQLLKEGLRAEAEHEKCEDTIADNVLTDNVDESWNSGRTARPESPVELRIDLGAPTHVEKLDLLPYQVPTPAHTHHRLYLDDSLVAEIKGETKHHGEIEGVQIGARGRVLRVQTVESPSWVAWSRVRVYGVKDV